MASTLSLSLSLTKTTSPTFTFPIATSYSVDEPLYQEVEVPADAAPHVVPLGGITTSRILVIESSAAVTLTINGASTIAITDVFMLGGDVTALAATNNGTAVVTLKVSAAEAA